jgi:hypothetical protein
MTVTQPKSEELIPCLYPGEAVSRGSVKTTRAVVRLMFVWTPDFSPKWMLWEVRYVCLCVTQESEGLLARTR